MPRLRLLSGMDTPEGVLPAGTVITVDDAEARILRGAIGLVEDAPPEAEPAPQPPEPGSDAAAGAAGDAGGVAGTHEEPAGEAAEPPAGATAEAAATSRKKR